MTHILSISGKPEEEEELPDARSAVSPSTDQQVTVVEGVTTTVVVFISLSSFLIGVCLTGALWIIHVKTGIE